MTSNYFFDSYALKEIFENNPKYVKYSKEKIIITKLNLMELFYAILRDYGIAKANEFYELLKSCVVEYSDEIMKKAMIYRHKRKSSGKNISYADAIGYIYAIENKLRFLTGDQDFETEKNVEFIKK